ncbi:hypothetical protein ABL78_2905 [Leptomonas seymouri]|uniref:Protein kinase domain-containing protein n=1 Tax=Leptomonas seymouri TaxID=5684 RepID=A0A0N0P6U6_LEPSE|nr:hypothetical protein ABL78_2905 [Leptomonas seymouri]|eukprot:KPI88029.1 hypothetical protein ABL78_2905 [Leptomonas seymouri]
MTMPKKCLGAVHHVSEHSVFFLPSHSDHLDFETLGTAPPCHRAVLQRSGLVAKIYAAATFYEDKVAAASTRHSRTHEEGALVKHDALSLDGRQEVWRSALTYAGLLVSKDAALHIPTHLESTPWPYVTLSQYRKFVKQAIARANCAAVNSSNFCVPILSVQEYAYKRLDIEVSLAVMWMPRYPLNLRQWAATLGATGRPIPEPLLLAMLHHITIAQLTIRSGDTMAGRSELTAAAASVPTLDSVLVHASGREKEGGARDWSDEPTFVLSASASDENSERPADSPADSAQPPPPQQFPLYRSPEECNPMLYPALALGTTKRAVWGLGIVLYLLASGRAHLVAPQGCVALSDGSSKSTPHNQRRARVVEETLFNAAVMTPDALWRRLRRDLEPRGYGGTLTTVVAQLLSLDPLTRPSLTTVDRMLQDLHRPTPIHRFPFAIGSYDLLRLPNPTSTIELNPGARQYTFAEVCLLCKKPRGSTAVCLKGGDHQATGVTSPSWNDESELLPAVVPVSESTYMTFLHPLCGAADERQRRRLAAHALQNATANVSLVMNANPSCCNSMAQTIIPLHCGFLLQVFGGFAVYERLPEQNSKGQVIYKVKVRDVLIPYPSQGLRRDELPLVKTTLEFGGGMPWPSCCTETLQKSGRVSRHVPFSLTGSYHGVEWFGWVLPGERFAMPNGAHWTAPRDGAFVFWFGANLQPTDRDRYFAVTNVGSATLPTKVSRTLLPDSLFRQHVGDESQASLLLMRNITSPSSRSTSKIEQSDVRANAARRRTAQSVTDIVLPSATHEILEADEQGPAAARAGDAVLHSALIIPASQQASATEEAPPPRHTRRHHSSTAGRRRRPDKSFHTVVARDYEDTTNTRVEESVQVNAAHCPRERAAPKENVAHTPSTTVAFTSNTENCGSLKHSRQSRCATPEPQSNGENPIFPAALPAAAAAATDVDNYMVAGAASPSVCSSPAAYGRIASRETTRPPSHRDTRAKGVRELAPRPVNELTRRSHGSAKGVKKQKPSVLVMAETPSAATPHGSSHAQSRSVSVQKRAQALSAGGSAGSSVPPLPQLLLPSPGAQNSKRKLSPRPLKRLASPRVSTPNSPLQPLGVFATPTLATPKRVPLSHAVSALSMLRVFGRWLPMDSVDAAFQALTFWVFSTGEYGHMPAPSRMSSQMVYALRAPPGAVYLSFMSSEIPLFYRNHSQTTLVDSSLLLPHHGFACYNAAGNLLGVLALRCSMKDDANVIRGEFVIDTYAKDPCHGSQISSRHIYASYLAGSVGDEKAKHCDAAGEAGMPMSHQCYSQSITLAGQDSRISFSTPPDAQTLTFTSARHLIGEFTPHRSETLTLHNDSTPTLPACWMGFDGSSNSLLFSDVGQSAWVPYGIGD